MSPPQTNPAADKSQRAGVRSEPAARARLKSCGHILHRRAELSLAVGTAARSVLGHRFWAQSSNFGLTRLAAVAERVGALSQWGRTVTRRGRLHIGTLHQREPISHAQHMSPWRPHRVLHAGGTAGCGQCSTMRQGRIGRGSSITVRVELSFQSSASKSRLAAQRLDIEMASRRMLAQRRADQRQERCTSTSPTR